MLFPATINTKYKTTMCKHFQTTGQCAIGSRCHFAHGQEELRNPADPIALNNNSNDAQQLLTQFMQGPLGIHNYKTIPCRYHELGICKYKDSCHFAHGNTELRNLQNDPSTINQLLLVQQYNQLVQQQKQLSESTTPITGDKKGDEKLKQDLQKQKLMLEQQQQQVNQILGSQILQQIPQQQYNVQNDPNIQRQIIIQQLNHILQGMQTINLDKEDKAKMKISLELLQAQNIQSCATLLNDIINNEELSQQNKKILDEIIKDAAQLAVNLLAQYQVQLSTMH